MTRIDDLLAKATETKPEHVDVPVVVAGELVTLRFYDMDGTHWAELTAANPVRPGVLLDMNYGYNLHAVVRTAAAGVTEQVGTNDTIERVPAAGRVLESGEEIKLPAEKWDVLFSRLSGHDFASVTDAVWSQNEWAPSQLVERLKKASTPARKKKRA